MREGIGSRPVANISPWTRAVCLPGPSPDDDSMSQMMMGESHWESHQDSHCRRSLNPPLKARVVAPQARPCSG